MPPDLVPPPPPERRRRVVSGYHSRSERRLARRAARRRRRLSQLLLLTMPTLIVVVIGALLLARLGRESTLPAPSFSTAQTGLGGGNVAPEAGLLLAEEGGSVRLALIVYPQVAPGLVIGIPGITLLRFADGFQRVDQAAAETLREGDGGTAGTDGGQPGTDVSQSGGEVVQLVDEVVQPARQQVAEAFARAFGLKSLTVVSVEWERLRQVLATTGVLSRAQAELLAELDPEGAVAGQVAGVVAAWVTALAASEEGAGWDSLPLRGEADSFRRLMTGSVSVGSWLGFAVRGRLGGEGVDRYLEPLTEPVKRALAGESPPEPVGVDVQNGSGYLGVAEAAAQSLTSLGLRVVSIGNAKGFPDVTTTRVVAAPDVELEAQVVRRVLGLGAVASDETLGSGRVVVILGRDYSPGN